ncbi:MAG: V-type ATP synthase subunit F [Clostridiales bacterium]|jgi:V/A-type H+-transporting ATPase subunit F|nr:V-type ATP synthase subunit F [Clostridiales bacterium]
MYRIAVMGDKDSIYGFAALGLEIYPTEDPDTAVDTLKKLAHNDYAVIYITEALAAKIPDEIEKYRDRITPAIILIPGIFGNTGMGINNVKRAVEKAVGSDILN